MKNFSAINCKTFRVSSLVREVTGAARRFLLAAALVFNLSSRAATVTGNVADAFGNGARITSLQFVQQSDATGIGGTTFYPLTVSITVSNGVIGTNSFSSCGFFSITPRPVNLNMPTLLGFVACDTNSYTLNQVLALATNLCWPTNFPPFTILGRTNITATLSNGVWILDSTGGSDSSNTNALTADQLASLNAARTNLDSRVTTVSNIWTFLGGIVLPTGYVDTNAWFGLTNGSVAVPLNLSLAADLPFSGITGTGFLNEWSLEPTNNFAPTNSPVLFFPKFAGGSGLAIDSSGITHDGTVTGSAVQDLQSFSTGWGAMEFGRDQSGNFEQNLPWGSTIPSTVITGFGTAANLDTNQVIQSLVVVTLNGETNLVSTVGGVTTLTTGTSNQFTPANLATLNSALQSVPANVVTTNNYSSTNVWYVSALNGNDLTGIAGQPQFPFLHITNAVKNAQIRYIATGHRQLVSVAPGQYNDYNLLKPGLDYKGDDVMIFHPRVTTNDDGWAIFDDRSCGATTNNFDFPGSVFYLQGLTNVSGVSNYWLANPDQLDLIPPWNTNNVPPTGFGTIITTNAGTELEGYIHEVDCGNIIDNFGEQFVCVGIADNNNSHLKVDIMRDPIQGVQYTVNDTTDGNPDDGEDIPFNAIVIDGINWFLGVMHFECPDNQADYYGVWINEPFAQTSEQDFYYKGDSMVGKIYTSCLTLNEVGWFTITTMFVSNSPAIDCYGSGKMYFSGLEKILSGNTACIHANNGTGTGINASNVIIYVTTQKLSAILGSAWADMPVGTLYLSCQHFDSDSPATTLVATGNGRIVCDAAFSKTNFISGKIYTNDYAAKFSVYAEALLTPASVAGAAEMDLVVTNASTLYGVTVPAKLTTIVGSLVTPVTEPLQADIPPNCIYYFTNLSTGTGNSSSIVGGSGIRRGVMP